MTVSVCTPAFPPWAATIVINAAAIAIVSIVP